MFKFLKEKISNWAKKIVFEKTEPEEKLEIKPKKVKGKEKSKKSTSEKEKKIKEIEVPLKFNPGLEKFEPDTEKIQKINREEPQEEKGFFSRLKQAFTTTKITEEDFSNYAEELQMILLENNVAYEVAEKIIEQLKEKVVNKEIKQKELESKIRESLKEIIEEVLLEPTDIIKEIKAKTSPYVILFCGINGSGKTTTIAKIAKLLEKNKLTCLMAAGDTFRAASIEQLKTHGKKLNVHVIAQEYGADPAAVGFDAIKYAEKNRINVVLIDTAGRMHTATNLLREIEKVARVCKPDKKIFVGESITGNDAVDQVKAFNEAIGIDGIILSKADIDEKAGTILSVGYTTGKPILFLGTGQEYENIEIFNKKKFISGLLD